MCLTGGDEGPLEWALRGGEKSARAQVQRLTEIFGARNIYAELQRHRLREEERRNQAAMDLAQRFHLPLLATNGVNFAEPSDRDLMDVLTCIRHKTNVYEAGRLLAATPSAT